MSVDTLTLRWSGILLGILFIAAMLSACGDSDGSAPQTTSSTPQTTSSTPQTTSSTPQTTSSTPQTTSSAPQTTSSTPQTTSSAPQTTSSTPQATPAGGSPGLSDSTDSMSLDDYIAWCSDRGEPEFDDQNATYEEASIFYGELIEEVKSVSPPAEVADWHNKALVGWETVKKAFDAEPADAIADPLIPLRRQ